MAEEQSPETVADVVEKFDAVSDAELEAAINALKADAYDHVVTIGRYNADLQQLQLQYDERLAKLSALLKLQEERAARAPAPNRAARRARPVKAPAKRARKRK